MRQNNAPVQINTSFGDFIRYKRENLGLTQGEVALLAGTTQGYLSKVEKGSREPTLTLALKLCEVLKLDINDFAKQYI
jgi:transcriptional regulator with XRE-family HTH domain